MHKVIFKKWQGRFKWQLVHNNRVLAESRHTYTNIRDALRALNGVAKIFKADTYLVLK